MRGVARGGNDSSLGVTSINFTLPPAFCIFRLRCIFLHFLLRFPFVLSSITSCIFNSYGAMSGHSTHIGYIHIACVPIPHFSHCPSEMILSLSIVLVSTIAPSIHISCVRSAI